MALSHGRSYHQRSAFAMNFLRPSLYINGDPSSEAHDGSRRPSNESNSVVWREVYASIVANADNFVLDGKLDSGDHQRHSSIDLSGTSTTSTCHLPSISITRQLAFGKCLDDNEDSSRKRRFPKCKCSRTCASMFASVALVAICFAGVLVLRVKEMELEKRLLEAWLKSERSKSNLTDGSLEAGPGDHGVIRRWNRTDQNIHSVGTMF